MLINYLLLVIAVALLWTPRQAFRVGKTVLKEPLMPSKDDEDPRKTRAPGDISLRFLEEVRKPRNYLEFLRALSGGFFLVGTDAFGAALAPRPHPVLPPGLHEASGSSARTILLAYAAILAIGVIVQTLRFDGRSRLYPPVFYLTGLAFVLAGWKAALFAVILAWLVNRSLPTAAGFFGVFALLLAGFGFVFDGKSLMMFLACALLIIPAALSLLSGRPLVAINRRVARSSED